MEPGRVENFQSIERAHRPRRVAPWLLGLVIALLAPMATADAPGADEKLRAESHERRAEKPVHEAEQGPLANAATARTATRAESPAIAPIVYVPPDRGRALRTTGAGTRGTTRSVSLVALAPNHLGLSLEASPTLYWHLSAKIADAVDFVLVDEESIDPILELRFDGPVRAGVHALELARFGIELDPETRYAWYVVLVGDPSSTSDDVAEQALIQRVRPEELTRRSPATERRSAPAADSAQTGWRDELAFLAQNGIWYDAVDLVESQLITFPNDALLRAQRQALLDQVDLPEISLQDAANAARLTTRDAGRVLHSAAHDQR